MTPEFSIALGAIWAPEEILFAHPKPLEWRQHSQAFSASARFGQRTNAWYIQPR